MIYLTLTWPEPRTYYRAGADAPSVVGVVDNRFLAAGDIDESSGIDENAISRSVAATLDNSDGKITADFKRPPLRGEFFDDGVSIFAGDVEAVSMSPDGTLVVELIA